MKHLKKYILFYSILLVILTGCKEEAKPEDAFITYVEHWNQIKFDQMYDMLTTEAKIKTSKEEFIDRYSKIYQDIEVSDLKVSFEVPAEEEIEPTEEGTVTFTYDVSMETSGGPLTFSHTATLVQEEIEEEKNWYVDWNQSMIFPEMSEGDEIRLAVTKPIRGEIYDRNNKGLAINGQVYEIGLVPQEIEENRDQIIADVADELKLSNEFIESKLNASWVQPHYFVPITRVSEEDVELVRAVKSKGPGIHHNLVPSRVYPYKEVAANLIGYVATITQEDLDKLEGKGYTSTDILGKKGLEMVLEERLRGEKGVRVYIKKENEEVTLADKQPSNGENIKLAINIDIQGRIFEQLEGEVGAAAAIHPLTGETLALVSSPSFDPNDFVLGISSEKWQALNNDPNKPLLNRVGHTYSPGSTFKPITAAIALENNVITPEQTIEINDKSWRKDSSWGEYYVTRVNDIKGPMNLRNALVYSDNIFFAKVAVEMGKDMFEGELGKFGFGESLPFEYPFYDSQISNNGINSEVLLADSAYGQGEVQMTPLHLAITYTPLLNEGNLLKPRLILEENSTPEIWHENVISPEYAKIILQDLVDVVEDSNGTGRLAKIEGITLAGKTGTAELKGSKDDQEGEKNGLFVAVNTENPELLIAMLVEDVEGSGYVVPKVKNVFVQTMK